MPIQNGKYVNPGWLNNGPPAIDAAEMNAISDTLENLDAGGGTGGGKRYARFVIGTSTNGWTSADCDYLCDGVDDQEEFNQAIAAFGTGSVSGSRGTIVVLSGTYHLTAPLSRLAGISLIGTGGVILLRETVTGASQYNYMIGITYGSIENISYYVSENLTFPRAEETIEVYVSAGAEIKNCDFNFFHYTAICIDALNIADVTKVSECTFFPSLESNENRMDIHITSGVFLVIENNFLHNKIYVDGPSSGTINSFRILNNSYSGVTNGEIVLDGVSNGIVAGNTVGNIQVLNTQNYTTLEGIIITGNIMGGPSDIPQPLITLGENTSHNYVFGNSLYYNTAKGYVQDNGTDNYVYDWQSGGTQGDQVTLSTSGWSSNTQTVSAPGVTATNYVIAGPDPSDFAAAMEAGVYCSGQGNGTLTFTCSTTPTTAITINYTAQEVF